MITLTILLILLGALLLGALFSGGFLALVLGDIALPILLVIGIVKLVRWSKNKDQKGE